MKKFFKSFILTILIVTILFVGSISYFIIKNHIENPGDFISDLNNGENRLTFLLLGVDNINVDNTGESRSDTIMIVDIDLETGNSNIISIPRDTYAAIKGHGNQKLNHSYHFGGTELTLDTVNNLLNTDIKYYMAMDYEFVKDVVNTVGGVEVDVPIDMDYEDLYADPPLKIHLKKGMQNLNGDEAIQFLRFRKGYADQDLSRVQAQQQFVSSFLNKIKTPSSFIKAPVLLSSYDKYTVSNIPFSQIVKLGINIRNISKDSIEATTLPGNAAYKNRISYFFLHKNETKTLLENKGLI
ncbi:MAG: LCP family protein [Peptoniphilaceae bacterium]